MPKVKKSPFQVLWPMVGDRFTQIPRVLLQHHHEILVSPRKNAKKPSRPLNSTEVLVLIHLLQFYWTPANPPRPTIKRLAHLVGLRYRAVQDALTTLRKAGLIKPERHFAGGQHRYLLDGLLARLQEFHAADVAKKQAQLSEAA